MSQKLLITLDEEMAEWLNSQQNKSDTVRKALSSYRDGSSVDDKFSGLASLINLRFDALEPLLTTQTIAPVEVQSNVDALSQLNLGFACCKMSKPCKHWHFDDVTAVWVNELTKETRET